MAIFQKSLKNNMEKKDFENKTVIMDQKEINQCCFAKELSEDSIRQIAYFRWLAATGGSPVSEEESQNFWLEAERQLFENN